MRGRSKNYPYGGATKSYVPGVQSGNHSNPNVMKIAEGTENRNSYAAGGRCGMAEGGSSRPRLDRPGRKMGGRIKKADGGDINTRAMAQKQMDDAFDRERKSGSAARTVRDNMAGAVETITGKNPRENSTLIGKPNWPDSMLDKKSGGKIPSGFIKHPGALRKSLNVKEGEKIPAKKLKKAEHSDNPKLRKRAVLAETMKHWHHGKK